MASKQETPNMGHRHSLTIETNPLHLLPSNIRRFSQADSIHHPAASMLTKLKKNSPQIPEQEPEKKDEPKEEQK